MRSLRFALLAGDPETHLFLTLQAMGTSEAYQAKVFDAVGEIVQRKRSETLTEQEVQGVAARLPGIDKAKFTDTWNSFGVKTMLNRLPGIVSNNYKIDGTPTIVIDGKYATSPGQVAATTRTRDQQQLFQETLQVAGALVTKVQTSK
jgi:thiol:disulfide interchange protein DsbA